MTPSDATEADLKAISVFLYQELTKNNTNLNRTIDDYQDLAFSKFGQVFNSDEWDRWFDNEIQELSEKIRDGQNTLVTETLDNASEHDKDSLKETPWRSEYVEKDYKYNSSSQDDKVSGADLDGQSANEVNVLNRQNLEVASAKNIHVPATHTLYSWAATNIKSQVPATHTIFSWTGTVLPTLRTQFSEGATQSIDDTSGTVPKCDCGSLTDQVQHSDH